VEWNDNVEKYDAFVGGRLDGLAKGRHAFSLKVLEKERGRESFSLSAIVRAQDASPLAWWSESVTLGVGDSWTGELEIR
jgi:hypothetical protein